MTSPLAEFSACEVSDALIKLGVKTGGYLPDITMRSPAYDDLGTKVCGPAYTVQMVDAKDDTSPKPKEHFVDAAPSGSVVVIAAPAGECVVHEPWGVLTFRIAQSGEERCLGRLDDGGR